MHLAVGSHDLLFWALIEVVASISHLLLCSLLAMVALAALVDLDALVDQVVLEVEVQAVDVPVVVPVANLVDAH